MMRSFPRLAGLVIAILVAVVLVAVIRPQPAAATETIFGDSRPKTSANDDSRAVELGVRFSSDVDGRVTGIRFYRDARNAGPHTGTLWDDAGKALATVTFAQNTADGWQHATLEKPVVITSGRTYVASYRAPAGRYAGDHRALEKPFVKGHLTVPQGGGVFSYDTGVFPQNTWLNSNYFVDIEFAPSQTGSGPGSGGTPTPPPAHVDPPSGALNLPRVPWEGRDYWAQFSKAKAAGWAEPTFFPIANWWSVATTPQDVASDRSMGLNTYVVTNPQADYRLIEDGGMFWVGGPLPHATNASKNWVGTFLDDEVDGRFEPADGYALLKERADAAPPSTTGRFRYANYTSGLLSYDRPPAVTRTYTNAFTELVSVDQYFYGTEHCDWPANSMRWSTPKSSTAITPANCRTSSSYGKMVQLLREADATDGRLQPLWNFVSVVGEDSHRLDFDKVQGQVMNSLIHEARGIIWFPQSFSGGCETGNAFRTYQHHHAPACLKAQVDGARHINALVTKLAPVLNTQSYVWTFGTGLDTMLKTSGDSAYIFAMTKDGGSGKRTFALPPGLGSEVEVVGENRSIRVEGNSFSDTFAKESAYHIYKIKLTSSSKALNARPGARPLPSAPAGDQSRPRPRGR